jgi:hypothetical protein
MSVPRSVTLPAVIGVWVVTGLVATYSCVMLPWFVDYCDFYQTRSAVQFGGVTKAFLRFHLIGVPLSLCIFGYGIRIIRSLETNAAHLAWYCSASLSLAAFWQTWALLAERSLYSLLFPA